MAVGVATLVAAGWGLWGLLVARPFVAETAPEPEQAKPTLADKLMDPASLTELDELDREADRILADMAPSVAGKRMDTAEIDRIEKWADEKLAEINADSSSASRRRPVAKSQE